MDTARVLNVTAIIFFAVSMIIFSPVLIYLSIAFLAASIIFWRIAAKRNSKK
jgi:hypothetical protein